MLPEGAEKDIMNAAEKEAALAHKESDADGR